MSLPQMKPVIAVFSGPTATIQNSPTLVTANAARLAHDLPPILDEFGSPLRFDSLRPQRLAAPVTVFIEQFSAHPLERDAADLYGPPDGWMVNGEFSTTEPDAGGVPVYRVELRPSDGLYMLPYVARQASGLPWDETGVGPLAAADESRQMFYPDAHRIYEEIDRFALDERGYGSLLASQAEYDFYRPAPSGGYTKGLPHAHRTDCGPEDLEPEDIEPERLGTGFFAYYPRHLKTEPDTSALAHATNMVQSVLATGKYVGAQWLEGSPTTEETLYWMNLLIDSKLPIVGHAAQHPHGSVSADGDRNILDGVKYILSRVWSDEMGGDIVGAVMIVDHVVFAAREVAKTDARPGGYQATGGHGGIVATMGNRGGPELTYIPVRNHTHRSLLNISQLGDQVPGVRWAGGHIREVQVAVKSADGALVPAAMPNVSIVKYGRWDQDAADDGVHGQIEILARITENLRSCPLAGFVGEGASPYGTLNPPTDRALAVAAYSGMPVVKCGRGNTAGFVPRGTLPFISGSNLTSTKARMLLMACILRLGALPPALDPHHPTPKEARAVQAKVEQYQRLFDSH